MTAWETEDEYAAAAQASLPTATDTPYRTPKQNRSRRSSRRKSNSPGPSSSPPPGAKHNSKDITHDESISILDPRRFTPTLHANLVSEILTLRRDQEEKTKTIESLEAALHESRGEQEELEGNVAVSGKENRSLKRQLDLLEGGTSSAISELAKERDEAVDSNADLKKRLETAQRKIRSQEDDSTRVHDLWSNDRDKWDSEKRNLNRKVHIAEQRLKKVLEEFAAYEASQQNGQTPESEAEIELGHGNGSETASVRTMSMTNSIRFSLMSGPNGANTNGLSLADELNLSDGEDTTDLDGRESALSLRHRRKDSLESMLSRNHVRNQSMESLKRPGSSARGGVLAHQTVLEMLEDGDLEDNEIVPVKAEYCDTGVQFSPPPSPKLEAVQAPPNVEPAINGLINKFERQSPTPREWEVEANQRRKRVHANPPLIIEPSSPMVSAASQTLEDPLSPPRTPISPTRAPPPPPADDRVEMMSISTQTDPVSPPPPSPNRAPPPPPIEIPSIQLHPPNSAPATPHEPLLPQHSKDAACQVSMQSSVTQRSISVQTEEIRVDKRLNFLPPHLQPSAISSKPPSPEPTYDESRRFSPVPGNLPPRNPRRMKSRNSLETDIPSSPPQFAGETRDAYPGNNDDGPLARDRGSIRRPQRTSSLFAGFDNVSSDEADDFADADMSDNDYRTALSAAPKPQSASLRYRRVSGPTSASIQEYEELSEVSRPLNPPRKSSMKRVSNYDAIDEYSLSESQAMPLRSSMTSPIRQLDKPLSLPTNNGKPSAMRKAALIQSGVAAHHGRSPSPSLPDLFKEPPFPIPTRASSRRPPVGTSAPSDGNRSPTWGRGSRGHTRPGCIRKVRSAAALPRGGRTYRRQGSRSPPPMSASTEAPESPQLPPMPNNEITTPRYMKETAANSRYRTHTRQQPSATTAHTTNTVATGNSVGSSNQSTSVVDAIAQTMVGEWMFKYVRRRKSFGVAESNALGEDGAKDRHKRWVWLAPYERAVMWSSKQPTSGSALMGKTGRKLAIQSVLDVKDDNPPPKGTPIFSRSILILTPARALKFTATTSERHYIWLTALSFLAHSSQAVPEIISPPLTHTQAAALQQAPHHAPDFEIPRQKSTRLRKASGIRDSIRIAKQKTSSFRSASGATSTSVTSSQFEGQSSLRGLETGNAYSRGAIPDFAADPPSIPRFSDRVALPMYATHGRKRSNTGPRVPPPLSFRGFSGPVTLSSQGHGATSSTAGMSVGSSFGSEKFDPHSASISQPGSSINGFGGGGSIPRSSEGSSRMSGKNFFDAVGTMRMEAFINPMAATRSYDGFPEEEERGLGLGLGSGINVQRRRSREKRTRGRGQRGSEEGWGDSGSKTAGEEEWGNREFEGVGFDPFRGF